MLISIVTPTYNSEEYLEDCILSIKNQKARNFEHIIIDGGSTDSTLSIIRKYENTYPMKWISEPDKGMYDAIAKGFRLAKGDVFCWLNSDDIYMPWATEVMEKVFKNSSIQWCSGFPSYLDSDGIMYQKIKFRVAFSQKCIRNGYMRPELMGSIQQEATFWRRELWEKSGGLDVTYKSAGDFHLWKTFANYAPMYTVNSVISSFRIHEGQKSADRMFYMNECGRLQATLEILAKIRFFKVINRVSQFLNKSYLLDINEL